MANMTDYSPSWDDQIKEAEDARESEDPAANRGLFTAALFGEHKYTLPQLNAVADTIKGFDALTDDDKDTLLACEQVHRLRDWISETSTGVILQSERAKSDSENILIEDQKALDDHLENPGHSSDGIFIRRDLLTKENLGRFKYRLTPNSLEWSEYLVSILPEEVDYVSRIFLIHVFSRGWREARADNRPMAERLGVGASVQLPQLYHVDEDNITSFNLRTDSDSEEMEVVKRYRDELDELSRGKASIAQERIASDKIRGELIPQLVKDRRSFQESYWTLHKARFEAEPHLIQNFSTTPFKFSDYVGSSAASDMYQEQVGALRKVSVRGGDHFLHIPPIYLDFLEQQFFQALEYSFRQVDSFDELTELIAKADCFLQIAHLPFDGSGRTTEDFLVYMAARAGYDISVSSSGYRHILDGGVSVKGATCQRFQNEVDRMALKDFGLTPGPYEDGNWLDDTEALATTLTRNGEIALAVDKALQAYYFVRWIEGGVQGTLLASQHYEHFAPLTACWRLAAEQEYIDSTEAPTEELDTLIAESLISPPFPFREKLRKLRDSIPAHPLTSLFFQSYLDGGESGFVSKKLQLHWNDLKEELNSGEC